MISLWYFRAMLECPLLALGTAAVVPRNTISMVLEGPSSFIFLFAGSLHNVTLENYIYLYLHGYT
jgi:hypothetical protein